MFVVAVAAVWLIAKASGRRGPALARPLLLLQFLLLTCVLVFSVIYHPAANPHGLKAALAAMIAVSAIACQFAFLRLAYARRAFDGRDDRQLDEHRALAAGYAMGPGAADGGRQ